MNGYQSAAIHEEAHTPDHRACPACAKRAQKHMQDLVSFRSLSVLEAGKLWTTMRQVKRLKPLTHIKSGECLRALSRFFGDLPLAAITPGHLKEYQNAREANAETHLGVWRCWSAKAPHGEFATRADAAAWSALKGGAHRLVQTVWPRTAGAALVNHELNVLKQLLVFAGLWERIKPWYSALPIPAWSPREIPDVDQEARLLSLAGDDPRSQLALWVAVITANTSASGSELRHIRLKHLFLRNPVEGLRSEIFIPPEGCKNNIRPRKIPLNDSARWAFERCYARALKLGATHPDHYLFPLRLRPHRYEPAKPATKCWLRCSWRWLRKASGLPRLKPHDLRLLFVTRSLEAGTRPEVVQDLSGHRDWKSMNYYSKFRMEPKADAVDSIDFGARLGKKPPASARPWPAMASGEDAIDNVIPLRGTVN